MDLKIKGKVAMITGGGIGIGLAIASRLAAEGAKVMVTDINEQAAQSGAAIIQAEGGQALACAGDATCPDSVEAMMAETCRAFGGLDILVNNAGGGFGIALVAQSDVEQWDKTITVNLKSTYLCCRAAAQIMMPRKQGRIINISSVSGKSGEPLLGSYCAAKFGVIGFTQVLAKELARYDITVNAVCPGYVYTPGWEKLAQGMKDRQPALADQSLEDIFDARVKAVTPLRRPQSPEDIASLVAYLASEEARNITGQAINVDGGAVMR